MHKDKLLLLGIFGIVIVIVVAMRIWAKPTTSPQPQNQLETAATLPAEETQSAVSEVNSADGTKKLTLKTTTDKSNQTQTFALQTSDLPDPIFTKIVGLSESISLPGNTWSPDHKYIFIEEKSQAGNVNYLVLKASGEPFADGQQYYDLQALFTAKKTTYTLQEATGWASPTLLIFTTYTDQGTTGPSFWFEVPSKAIIQLSR